MDKPMRLTEEEKSQLESCRDENEWYKICDQIKERRNDQYPNYSYKFNFYKTLTNKY